ncbi:MAG: HEAT repeat domain-containing protein [Polyangiaceae bacterium]
MKRRRPLLLGVLCLSFFATTGCSASPGDTPRDPVSGTTRATSTTSAPADAQVGLQDPNNDPAIVALAKGVLSCHWKVGHGYSKECPAGVAWYETELFHDKKSLPTLVSFLEDADPAVRAIAAEALRVYGHEYQEDASLCLRVVSAAEREKDPELLEPFGALVGAIDLERTNLVDRALALAKTAPVELREEQISSLVGANPYSQTVFSFVTSALHDPEARIRAAAITTLGETGDAEACELLEKELGADTEEAYLVAHALTYGGNGDCRASFDAVLRWLERPRTGELASARLTGITEQLCRDRTATATEEKRGAAVLRGLVLNAHLSSWDRASALRSLGKCDVDSKAFASTLQTDDEELKRAVEEVSTSPSEAEGPAPDTIGPDEPDPPAIDTTREIRSIDAVSFLSTWDPTREGMWDIFPPGPYRVAGTVIGVSRSSHGRVELSLAGPPGTAVHLHWTGSQATQAGRMRRGQSAKAVCDFHGDGGRGYANFTDCHWED